MITAITEKLPNLSLTYEQSFKVIAVAVATLCVFGSSWALFSAGLTLLSEATMRAGSKDSWYDKHTFTFGKFFEDMTCITLGKIAIAITYVALIGLGLFPMPVGPAQTNLAKIAVITPTRFFFLAVVQAPICEEIVFRGFLQERFEDCAELFHRYIYPIPKEFQKKIANVAQAILFGLAHITGNQVAPGVGPKCFVATVIGWSGYIMGKRKAKDGNLVLPTILHSTNNFIASASLLFGRG